MDAIDLDMKIPTCINWQPFLKISKLFQRFTSLSGKYPWKLFYRYASYIEYFQNEAKLSLQLEFPKPRRFITFFRRLTLESEQWNRKLWHIFARRWWGIQYQERAFLLWTPHICQHFFNIQPSSGREPGTFTAADNHYSIQWWTGQCRWYSNLLQSRKPHFAARLSV